MVYNTRSGSTSGSMDGLRHDIEKLSTTLTRRLDDLEESLTDRIKLALVEHIDKMKDEFNGKINGLLDRMEKLEGDANLVRNDDCSCNYVDYGLSEEDHENVEARVNALVKDELNLDVEVKSAVRKPKYHDNQCGVIVVKCHNSVDKSKVMKAKSSLNTSARYKHIRIYHDKPKWQRLHESNMRQIVRCIGTDKLVWRNNRVCEPDARLNNGNRTNNDGRDVNNDGRGAHGGGRGYRGGRGQRRGQGHDIRGRHGNRQF